MTTDRTVPVTVLLERIASAAPDTTAVQDGTGTLTWGELAHRVRSFAHRLTSVGVRSGDRVGMLLPHTGELLVSALAIMRVGAAYVPLDPAYPLDHVRHVAADARFTVLVTDRDPGIDGVVAVHPAETGGDPWPAHPLEPDDLACVIYTSGSTGTPKGVMITHRGLSSLAHAADAEFTITAADRSLMLASASFSASLEELFPPLLHGATCVFPPDRMALSSVHDLLAFVRSQSITLLGLQPHQWHLLTTHTVESGTALPPSLRLVVVGGDRLQPHTARLWKDLGVTLVHVYGSTETTATTTYLTVPPGGVPEDGVLSLGEPIPGVRLHLVDGDLRPVEPGAVGELLIAGDALAAGYLHRPEETASRFLPDPFTDGPGSIYRTGDLARRLPDGRLVFVDRVDRQVKIRGHRVEPNEVEAALVTHPRVREAVVLPWEDPAGERRLVAYIGADPGATNPAELRDFASARLPAHLVPSVFVQVDEFPLTVNRKIDRNALPTPVLDTPRTDAAPVGSMDRELSDLAAGLLGVDSVGAVDDFIELGADSLFFMRMVSEVELRYGAYIAIADAFAERTPRRLAALVRGSRPTREPAS
ncbi:non-ribosomal peptide synthetase [Streptomyces scopuliridis]|uniref:non-ribosomal peptide synthetase n=1 Tax=Streptomyces scopuliridis TaxID=452529 RepID=UPI0035DBDC14